METSDSSPEDKKDKTAPSSENIYPFDKLDPGQVMCVPARILKINQSTGTKTQDILLTPKEMIIIEKRNLTKEQLAEIIKKRQEEIEKEKPGEEIYSSDEIYYDQDTGKIIKKKPEVSLG